MRKSVLRTIERVRPFIPVAQFNTMRSLLRGEERSFFREAFRALESTIDAMPVTYQQSELGDDAVVHLHYFYGGADWWITEKDKDGETAQAYGLVDLGQGPELGYISIDELVRHRGLNIDLHWKPVTLAQLKAKKYPPPAPAKPAYSREMILNVEQIEAAKPANGVYH